MPTKVYLSLLAITQYTFFEKETIIMSDSQLKTIVINENKVAIAFALIPFSIAGTLIRIALTRLQDYPGMPVFGLVYAQWVGCLIMGIAVKCKIPFIVW